MEVWVEFFRAKHAFLLIKIMMLLFDAIQQDAQSKALFELREGSGLAAPKGTFCTWKHCKGSLRNT